jgi:hypothetical protein
MPEACLRRGILRLSLESQYGHASVCTVYLSPCLFSDSPSANWSRYRLHVDDRPQQGGNRNGSDLPTQDTEQHCGDACSAGHCRRHNRSVHSNRFVQRRLDGQCNFIRNLDLFPPRSGDGQHWWVGHWGGCGLQHDYSIARRPNWNCSAGRNSGSRHCDVDRRHAGERDSYGRSHAAVFSYRDV